MKASIWRRLSRKQKSLGIEVTDSHVKVCEIVRYANQKASLLQFSSEKLPEGAVEDGKVNDWASLELTIRKALSAKKFTSKNVHFAVPSQMVMVRTLKLPDLSYQELKKLVRFEINNNISLAFEDPYYDFIKLPQSGNRDDSLSAAEENKPMCEVMVVAAPMHLLQEYRALFVNLGLVPVSFEIAPFAVLRLAKFAGLAADNVDQVIVNVNERQSEITILSNGNLEMTRYVDVAFKSIMDEQDDKQNAWLSSFSSPEQTFQNGVIDLIAELERVMNFYNYTLHNGQKALNGILLSGDLPEMDKLRDLMAERMAKPVMMLEWPELAPGTNGTEEWRLNDYAIAAGLALRGNER